MFLLPVSKSTNSVLRLNFGHITEDLLWDTYSHDSLSPSSWQCHNAWLTWLKLLSTVTCSSLRIVQNKTNGRDVNGSTISSHYYKYTTAGVGSHLVTSYGSWFIPGITVGDVFLISLIVCDRMFWNPRYVLTQKRARVIIECDVAYKPGTWGRFWGP